MKEQIFIISLCYLAAINLIAAAVVLYDKHISRRKRGSVRRVPERTFVRFSILGGGIGTLLCMLLIHHKTKAHDGLLLKIGILTLLWTALLCGGIYMIR
ncbi:MAG: DUF1294 domain-containing protein [Clostridia bacterium]|nr:DUF1294 domain-containing protein [Clostridia bacterium]